MVSTLFLRSYERGERVYGAMVSRGYDGRIEVLDDSSFGLRDTCFFLLVLPVLASVGILIVIL
jgi:cobalt/nickel transport system permease protein